MASQNPPYTNGQSHAGPSVSSLEPPHPSPALHRSSNGNGGSAEDDIPAHLYTRVPAHLLLPDGTPNYLRMILTARVYDIIQPTPLTKAVQLSGRLGVSVHFKREDLQPVFSFKCRGAYNCIAQLSAEEKQKGVVACSAGACRLSRTGWLARWTGAKSRDSEKEQEADAHACTFGCDGADAHAGRQPRAGRRAGMREARDPIDHRHAAQHAVHQVQECAAAGLVGPPARKRL